MSFHRLKDFWDQRHQMGGQHNNDWVKTNFDSTWLQGLVGRGGGGGRKEKINQSLSPKTISFVLCLEALQQSMN